MMPAGPASFKTITAGAAQAAMRALPEEDFATGFGHAPTLVLAPHPDDESLGCGGMIAEACARAVPPLVVILTDGSQSHPNSRAMPPAALRALRAQETAAATAALGLPPHRLVFMGYPDTQAPAAGVELAAAAQRLSGLLGDCGCIAAPWAKDPHGDHAAAAAIAAQACRLTGARLLSYPVWGLTLPAGTPLDMAPPQGFRLDVRRHLPRKRAAILAHRSQYAGIITDDPDGFQMTPDFMEMFLGDSECFLREAA